MKKYRIIITDEAFEQVRGHLRYIADEQQEPLVAQQWWERARASIWSLETLPYRCSLAPENDRSRHELRMLLVDRCLFIYHVDEENQTVWVVRFRHGSQEPRPIE